MLEKYCGKKNIDRARGSQLNHFIGKRTTWYFDIFVAMSLNHSETDFIENRYYRNNQIFLSILDLWPYRRSKFAKINYVFHFTLMLSFVFFQILIFFSKLYMYVCMCMYVYVCINIQHVDYATYYATYFYHFC